MMRFVGFISFSFLMNAIENEDMFKASFARRYQAWLVYYRLLARGSIAPPLLGNFADIPYLKEQFKLSRIRDVCTLSVGALSCNSLLHMLPKQN